jgi:L-cysteine/cystine lyase
VARTAGHNAPVGTQHEPSFGAVRAQFPVLDAVAYLNAGTFGPLARPVVDAVRAELGRDADSGRVGTAYFERLLGLRDEVRAAFARLLGTESSAIALTTSTTEGCNIVLGGLGLTAGDEVVTTSDEHFGLLGPLHASGARVVVVPPEPERIVSAVTPRTRLLALSHVLWTTGATLPVQELRERCSIPILVDGAQSVGAIPVDSRGLDFVTVSGQKWLCGPDTTGALLVADPERLEVRAPSNFSQASFEPDGTYVPRDGAMRFEASWWSAASLAGMLAAIDLRPPWWRDRAVAATRRCRTMLEPLVEVVTPQTESTLVAFRPHGDAAETVARLAEAGVLVREIPGRGIVRVSCGWWTSDEDVARLVAAPG